MTNSRVANGYSNYVTHWLAELPMGTVITRNTGLLSTAWSKLTAETRNTQLSVVKTKAIPVE